jgi:hypothetical protein
MVESSLSQDYALKIAASQGSHRSARRQERSVGGIWIRGSSCRTITEVIVGAERARVKLLVAWDG